MPDPIAIRDDAHLNELHAQYLTASRLGALYGCGRTTKFEEYHILRGDLPPGMIDNKMLKRGRMLESVVDKLVAEERGWEIAPNASLYPHPTIARFGATPDAHVRGLGVLERKVVAEPVFKKTWQDGPPLPVELQLEAQMMCTGAAWGCVAALVIGAYEFDLVLFERQAHAGVAKRLEADVAEFLADVEAGREPRIDPSADLEALQGLYRAATVGKVVELPGHNHLPVLCGEYKKAAADAKEAEARKEAALAAILDIVKDADTALTDGWRIKSTNVPGGPVAYERKPYRKLTITALKETA